MAFFRGRSSRELEGVKQRRKESQESLTGGPGEIGRICNAFVATDFMPQKDFREICAKLEEVFSQLKATAINPEEEYSPHLLTDQESIVKLTMCIDSLLIKGAVKYLLNNGNIALGVGGKYQWFDFEKIYDPHGICFVMTSFTECIWGGATETIANNWRKAGLTNRLKQYEAACLYYNNKTFQTKYLEPTLEKELEANGNFILVNKGRDVSLPELTTYIMNSFKAEFTCDKWTLDKSRRIENTIFTEMCNGKGEFALYSDLFAKIVYALSLCHDNKIENGLLAQALVKYKNMILYYYQEFPSLNPSMIRPPLLKIETGSHARRTSSPLSESKSNFSSPSQGSPLVSASSFSPSDSSISSRSPTSLQLDSLLCGSVSSSGEASPFDPSTPLSLGPAADRGKKLRASSDSALFERAALDISKGKRTNLFATALATLRENEDGDGVLYRPSSPRSLSRSSSGSE